MELWKVSLIVSVIFVLWLWGSSWLHSKLEEEQFKRHMFSQDPEGKWKPQMKCTNRRLELGLTLSKPGNEIMFGICILLWVFWPRRKGAW